MAQDILYSFRRCPYAIRARWAILSAKKSVEIREIDLKRKPLDLIKVSSKATVPILITSQGKVIDESREIMNWAIEGSVNLEHLKNTSRTNKSEIEKLIDQNDNGFKYHLDRYKYNSRYVNSDYIYHKNKALEIIEEWNERIYKNNTPNNQPWIIGAQESLADWALWPFVRQFRIANIKAFDSYQNLKPIRDWLEYFQNHTLFEILMTRYKPWSPSDKPFIFP